MPSNWTRYGRSSPNSTLVEALLNTRSRLYDPASATFSKGRIGRHRECFEERHFTLLKSLPQDFMQTLGYSLGSLTSCKTQELRQRPLVVKELSSNAFYTPRLVHESLLGWNIVEIAGKYFPIRQGVQITSTEEAKRFSAGQEGSAGCAMPWML